MSQTIASVAVDYRWPKYSKKTITHVAKFLEGDTFDLWDYGDIYDRVPRLYAEKLNIDYAYFCSSGTSALHASLMALGLKRGDRVIVPAMTFIRAVTPVAHMGIEPVLIDIDPVNGNITPEALEQIDDDKVKAVVVVHMWGVAADMDSILKIAANKGWKVIEDFSHAHFTETKQGYVGTLGDIGFASLQRKKTISLGEGGIITTRDKTLYKRVRQIVSPGSKGEGVKSDDQAGFGLNMRMSPLAVIIAESLVEEIDSIIAMRTGSANHMIQLLASYPDFFTPPTTTTGVSWYALKMKAKVEVEKLIQASKGTRWKISRFEYPMIGDAAFWNQSSDFFPFSETIQPLNKGVEFSGAKEYLSGRFGIKIPSLSPEEWTNEEIQAWKRDLALIVERL